jgi:hypothetical protein
MVEPPCSDPLLPVMSAKAARAMPVGETPPSVQ